MKAIIFTRYGSPDVIQFKEVAQPPLEDERVLVKVYAASVNALDWHSLSGVPFLVRLADGLRKPKDPRLGADLAGRVEAIGSKVTQFQVGDEVFGRGWGTFAEYACPRESTIVLKPSNISFEAAAAVPVAALTALQALRDMGQIQPGQQVAIYGAGGGVGTFAVQIAKAFGAEVTAVCSTRNVEMVRSIGADHVIDYTQTNFLKSGQRYDLILAVNGYHPILAYRRALTPNGRSVLVGASSHLMQALFQTMLLGPVISRVGKKKTGFFTMNLSQAGLVLIKEMLEAGKIVPVIDRRYPLSETAEAIRYLEEGHARGKVVITVDQNSTTA
jgi:NADPH:quinone reductase-like Zn-dependent oxidoreductase